MASSPPAKKPWAPDELLVVFRLYCRTPFGRLHSRNPDILQLARLIGRTPSAVAMKACNFASLDPRQQTRRVVALGNTSRADRALWDSFALDAEDVAARSEAAHDRLLASVGLPASPEPVDGPDLLPALPSGPTDAQTLIRTRRVQGFFRAAVLAGYEYRCALTGLAVPDLLNASHIIPWSVSTSRRADPRNGLCLNVLHDRAFDRGLLTFDESLRAVVSPRLRLADPSPFHAQTLLEVHGHPLRLPRRFSPDPEALAYHREKVFV